MTILFNIFLYTSWTLGLLLISVFSIVILKLLLLNTNSKPTSTIPEPLKKMIEASALHPEAQEIDETDELIGVLFEGDLYPPEFND